MKKRNQVLSAVLAFTMVAGMISVPSFAAENTTSYQDGTYTKTATVSPDEDQDFDPYDVEVQVVIEEGKITHVSFTDSNTFDGDKNNKKYSAKALTGVSESILAQQSTSGVDAVSSATCTSNAILEAVNTVLAEATVDASQGDDGEVPVTYSGYVLMNIPYAEFYAADVNNSVGVDAVSSATLNKTRTGSLVSGSYHVDAGGTDITGITFPVKVSQEDLAKLTGIQITDDSSVTIKVTNKGNTSETTYSGKDALFESGSYSYYVLDQAPSYYKELTVGEDGSLSFGAVQGETKQISATATITTDTKYGDYQVEVNGLPTINTVYGVILSTDEADYGLRHLENVWRTTELAWCTGFTTSVHNNPTSSAHYAAMMGQTINKITYITDTGIYTFDTSLYVPVKFSGSVTAENATIQDGTTTVTANDLPADFDPVYQVEGLDISAENGTLSFANAKPGQYTLVVSDKNGKYADLSCTFLLSTTEMPAAYDSEQTSLVAAENDSADQLSAYIAAISSVNVNGTDYAASGRGAVTIIQKDGTVDLTTSPFQENGTYTVKVSATGYPDLTFDLVKGEAEVEEEFTYLYAALTWEEYWASEDVYAAGSTASSSELDAKGETDKGAFDVVSRATTNHGLHRGSFQSVAVIYATNGDTYTVSYWTGSDNAVLTDGRTLTKASDRSTGITTLSLSDGTTATMDHYEVTGIKYVPVQVASADLEDFCKAYTVVKNGETLAGGFSEQNLTAYSFTAAVDENTNGLKVATKNSDGTFSFSPRSTGTGSGLKDTAQKQVNPDSITVTVKEANGSYGEFLRVDLTGEGYGDLGSNLYAVVWTYYGDDSSYTTALGTYGTKFAADNWMHKSMGIQLGLTDSLRCQLPEGTDGTGYWTITVCAMGYEDYTFSFQATEENIVKTEEAEQVDTSALSALVEQAKALTETDYTADSWKAMTLELDESVELLAKEGLTQAMVDEQVGHLSAAIAGLEAYVLPQITQEPETQAVAIGDTLTFAVAATGTELTYQWEYSRDGENWTISTAKGNKTDTLTLKMTKNRNGLQYRCVITDKAGNTVTSKAAVLYATATITAAPKTTVKAVGEKATFTVTALGQELQYQWEYSQDGVNWKKSTAKGSTSNALSVKVTAKRSGLQYRCVVTDKDGNTVTSKAATLYSAVTITKQTKKVTATVGKQVTFSVTAVGQDLTYRWEYSRDGETWKKSTAKGSKTATLSLSATAKRSGLQYRCVITDKAGNTVTSNPITLTVK